MIESDVEAEENESTRVFHEWHTWECYPAGFYGDKPPEGMTVADCEEAYKEFLLDLELFGQAIEGVFKDWPKSTEHYLTNEKMNRVAWIGQSAMCYQTGIPARFCGGYNLLSDEQKLAADELALEFLNKWLESDGRERVDMIGAGISSKANIY